jgi:tetratricopeptide (TPR) repeat protein
LLAESPSAGTEASARTMRATIRVARGDLAGAQADSARVLDIARRADEPQAIMPALATHAFVLDAAGETAEAAVLVEEIVSRLENRQGVALFPAPAYAIDLWLRYADRQRVRSLLAGMQTDTPWVRAGRLLADGDLYGALEIYRRTESVHDVACVQRLIAQELVASGKRAEADAHLDEALAFYRSVGATREILIAEKLLAATA